MDEDDAMMVPPPLRIRRKPPPSPRPLTPIPSAQWASELASPRSPRKKRVSFESDIIYATVGRADYLPTASIASPPRSTTTSSRFGRQSISSSSPSSSSVSSFSSSSPPSSPRSAHTPLSSTYPFPAPPPLVVPTHRLRHKLSPKRDTLRGIRAKESDACLQRIYERQTRAYLDGSVFFIPGQDLNRNRMRFCCAND